MPDGLGARLREVRTRQGLSLRSVAHALGVSPSLVSQIEVGKSQPSVATLYGLASHLGVSLDELVGATERREPDPATHRVITSPVNVQRAAENPVIQMLNGVRWERLASGRAGTVDALLVSYDSGASSSVDGSLMRHSAFEYAYVLEGELTLHLEQEKRVLRAGDSLHFDSTQPHRFVNDGPGVARGVWFVVGRVGGD
jgi:transcriptional regulator with XRE-family HTH domain